MHKWFTILILLSLPISTIWAQDSLSEKRNNINSSKKSSGHKSMNNKYISTERNISNYKELEDAIQENNDEKKYNEYINLADKLSKEKKYEESNKNLIKSLEYFSKQKDNKKKSEIHRKIAFNNEQLNNEKDALIQYKNAQEAAPNRHLSNSIQNDINRIELSSQPSTQEKEIEQQIIQLESSDDKIVLNQTYRQLADVALLNKDTAKAINALIQSSKSAMEEVEKIDLNDQLADIYASTDSIDKAIQVTKDARLIAFQQNDWTNFVNQTLKLQQYYIEAQFFDSAESVLKTTLDEAYLHKNTQAILILVKSLKNHYAQLGRNSNINPYYDRLLDELWQVALVDTNIYQDALLSEVSSRIELLEKDKENQKILYDRTQFFNTVLLLVSIVLLVSILLIIISLNKLKKKNYLIQLQSLRKEMNPHFIFNALNSVNLFIAQNDEISANKYLTSYSSLMRHVMTTSSKNFVTLQEEIMTLKDYIELEHMRFEEHFDYNILIDELLQDEHYQVPNMLIQPFVENAVWHGLRYKSSKGLLILDWKLINDRIQVTIEDDGIGYEQSLKIKSKNQQSHQSIGIRNTKERIRLLNLMFGSDIQLKTESVDNKTKEGHRVILSWSIKHTFHEIK